MTTREKAELMLSYEPGQQWQYRYIHDSETGWRDCLNCNEPVWDFYGYDYRRKPSPKLRAWKPEEVPVGALLRHKVKMFVEAPVTMILCVRGAWVIYFDAVTAKLENKIAQNLFFTDYEHSLDHGKTWLPCGVITED